MKIIEEHSRITAEMGIGKQKEIKRIGILKRHQKALCSVEISQILHKVTNNREKYSIPSYLTYFF